jgi:protoporphyrin/coproporphyrin ferrochelatase
MREQPGVLLINLGSPRSPSVSDVRDYLREFLMDPFVIDLPTWQRWLLVHAIILRFRPKKSAHAYQSIWTKDGSPLLVHSKNLTIAVDQLLPADVPVELGMRYSQPSIASALGRLKAKGVTHVLAVPLYPQYSLAATETAIVEAERVASNAGVSLTWIKDFYDASWFIHPLAQKLKLAVDEFKPDRILFSYHGIPERHATKAVKREDVCVFGNCCDSVRSDNRYCYRAQCFATTREIIRQSGIDETQTTVSFQSRLGRTPWIKPYTDLLVPEMPKAGVKRLLVLSPSFTADCLETLEELDIRLRADFMNAGGEAFHYLPCLNSDAEWAEGLAGVIKEKLGSRE